MRVSSRHPHTQDSTWRQSGPTRVSPLPLPSVDRPHLVTLVRHGESTWNAASLVQGASDLSVLTPKGWAQAEATAKMLAPAHFDQLWYSPLARSAQTARVVWGSRAGAQHGDPLVAEINFYSFQGLSRSEIQRRYPEQHYKWHHEQWNFELDGHWPLHEAWHRASLAWHRILAPVPVAAPRQPHSLAGSSTLSRHSTLSSHSTLLVGHSSFNQALIAAALGLPCSFFERLPQANAAMTQLMFHPAGGPGWSAKAVLQCVNECSSSTLRAAPGSQAGSQAGRVVLLVATPCPEQLRCIADELQHTAVHQVVAVHAEAPSVLCLPVHATAQLLAGHSSTGTGTKPTASSAVHVLPAGHHAWPMVASMARQAHRLGSGSLLVVADPEAAAGLMSSAMGLGDPQQHPNPNIMQHINPAPVQGALSFTPGGLTVLDVPAEAAPVPWPVLRCMNSTAHLATRVQQLAPL